MSRMLALVTVSFQQDILNKMAHAFGIDYATLAADYRHVEYSAAREYLELVRQHDARIALHKKKLRQCFFAPLSAELMFDSIGVQRGLRP